MLWCHQVLYIEELVALAFHMLSAENAGSQPLQELLQKALLPRITPFLVVAHIQEVIWKHR
jgi:hypothetical protein